MLAAVGIVLVTGENVWGRTAALPPDESTFRDALVRGHTETVAADAVVKISRPRIQRVGIWARRELIPSP